MKYFSWISYLILLLGLGRCAHLEIKPLADSNSEGLRFYRPWPHLLVTVDGDGKCAASITYLPDLSSQFVIIPHAGLGSVTLNPTLENGWNLTGLNSTVDTKFADNLNAVTGFIGKVAGAASGAKPSSITGKEESEVEGDIRPGLYRLNAEPAVKDKTPRAFRGLDPVFTISDKMVCKTIISPPPSGDKKEPGSGSGAKE